MAEAVVHKMGPGELSFGETGTKSEFGGKTKSTTLKPDVKTEDAIVLLNGDATPPVDTETWEISGEIYQSYELDSPTAWAFNNAGKTVPFTFVPNSNQKRKWTGRCLIRSLPDGGDVDTRNTAAFAFPVIGRPTLGNNP